MYFIAVPETLFAGNPRLGRMTFATKPIGGSNRNFLTFDSLEEAKVYAEENFSDGLSYFIFQLVG